MNFSVYNLQNIAVSVSGCKGKTYFLTTKFYFKKFKVFISTSQFTSQQNHSRDLRLQR